MGLFDYQILETDVYSLYSLVKKENFSCSQFIDIALISFENRTKSLLTSIKIFFELDLRKEFDKMLSVLEENIASIANRKQMPELLSAITKSRTDISNELQRISNWFELSNPKKGLKLSLESIIRTSVQITNAIYPNFKVVPNVKSNECELIGYISIVYILRILLDNIIIHSKLNPEELEVDIVGDLNDDNVLSLKITNNFSKEIDVQTLDGKLKAIKDKWTSKDSLLEKSNTEGGSGFDKIRKIIVYDMNRLDNGFEYEIIDNKLDIRIAIKFS